MTAQRSDCRVELLQRISQRVQLRFDNWVIEKLNPYTRGRRSCDRRLGRFSPPIDSDPFLQNTRSRPGSFPRPLAIREKPDDNDCRTVLMWEEEDVGSPFRQIDTDGYSTRGMSDSNRNTGVFEEALRGGGS